MAKRIKAFWKYLLASVISVLGLSSCTCNRGGDNGEVICEYGAPHTVFKLKVNVQDSEGNPVQNATLRIRTHKPSESDNTEMIAEKTDTNGVLTVDKEIFYSFDKDEVYVVYRSSDNPEQSTVYGNDSVKIAPVEVETEKKSLFVEGTYKVDGTLKLKEKPAASEKQ
ncbi:MAG: radical SAM-associated putative lipoprotein [Bacteroidales bacterium]|nr:radical SAM-associated putative lipoprotein [Bacteroidales bacterium]